MGIQHLKRILIVVEAAGFCKSHYYKHEICKQAHCDERENNCGNAVLDIV